MRVCVWERERAHSLPEDSNTIIICSRVLIKLKKPFQELLFYKSQGSNRITCNLGFGLY